MANIVFKVDIHIDLEGPEPDVRGVIELGLYHDLSSSALTADERREEASRIVSIIIETDTELTEKESKFLDDISNISRPVSVKQLFWLRDIKDKYL